MLIVLLPRFKDTLGEVHPVGVLFKPKEYLSVRQDECDLLAP